MPSSKTTMRSKCPVGYEPVKMGDSVNCPVVEDVLSDGDSSTLWLIKVPHDFDVSSLSGQEVILHGTQDLPDVVSKSKGKRYEVQSNRGGNAEARVYTKKIQVTRGIFLGIPLKSIAQLLSAFSVLLPSSQEKSLRAASSISGQMSIVYSVPVPPLSLPDSSDSLTVQRQTHSKYIKKWVPFGCREPHRKSKGKKMKESRKNAGDTTDGSRKKKRDRKTGREETSPGNNEGTSRESEGNKGDVAKKKKKKDKDRVELDLSRVKREPQADSDSEITTRKSEENFRFGRKRTSEINCADKREGREDANGVSPAKKRKDVARESMKAVKIKRELFSPERSPKSFSKGRQSDANISGVNSVDDPHDGVDLKRVKREPKETPKKSKKYRK